MEIIEVLVVRGLSETAEQTMREPTAFISVGIRLANGQVGWGDCVPDATGVVPSFTPSQATTTLQEVVSPVLVGQSILNLSSLLNEVSKLTTKMTVTETVQPPPAPPKPKERRISRRELFTQLLTEEKATPPPRPKIIRTVIDKPLDLSIQLGVNQALFCASALAQNMPLAAHLRQRFSLTNPAKIVPILPELKTDDTPLFHDAIRRKMPALIYTPSGITALAKIGKDGSKLVKTMQSWQSEIDTHVSEKYKPAFYFRLGGALGDVYEENAGKIFGYLFSLNTHAKNHPIYLEDLILEDTRDKQIATMQKLQGYARRRNLDVAFSAFAWVKSLADVQAYLQAEIVDCLHLNLSQFTHLPDIITAIQQCQEAGRKVLLSGANSPLGYTFLHHFSIATQPNWLLMDMDHSGNVGLHWQYQEMARTITQISG
jgi:methylaspartate ammonia-lyase